MVIYVSEVFFGWRLKKLPAHQVVCVLVAKLLVLPGDGGWVESQSIALLTRALHLLNG